MSVDPLPPDRRRLLLEVTLLRTDDGGRQSPIGVEYRPQLHLGQRLRSGQRIFWDCRWRSDRGIDPGGSSTVTMELRGLPDAVLQRDEVLEFYEGERLVARGWVRDIG